MPTSATRAVDVDALIDGARTQLLTNSTITTALDTAHFPKRIASELIAEGTTPPYIVLALASTIYESPYGEAVINTLLDVSCYTQGESTTTVRALMVACIASLVDSAWTATGFQIWSVNLEESGAGIRNVTTTEPGGIIMRGRQVTIRVRAKKT